MLEKIILKCQIITKDGSRRYPEPAQFPPHSFYPKI